MTTPTPSSTLPTAITDYFTHLAAPDKRATIDVFSADARVTDDGETYAGRDEILGWLGTTASEYTVTSTRLGADTTGDTTTVTVRLDGNFPGGTVTLRNVFSLRPDGLISALTIAP